MIKIGTRVVYDDGAAPTGRLGTVVDVNDNYHLALVEWDDGSLKMESLGSLLSFHALKAAFKHGPKFNKKGEAQKHE